MQIPIACSLVASDVEGRIEEWRRFLAGSVSAALWDEGVLRLELLPTQNALIHAVDLAGREKACCSFFSFSLEIEPDTTTLRIGVPADAEVVLDEFVQLLPPALRP